MGVVDWSAAPEPWRTYCPEIADVLHRIAREPRHADRPADSAASVDLHHAPGATKR
jgi:hypothetical protein